MEMVNTIISLVSGIIGGNIAGAAAPDKSLGVVGNSIAGLIGGGAGSFILQALGLFTQVGTPAAGTGIDIASILANVGSGGVSGAILMVIAGLIKNAMQKPS